MFATDIPWSLRGFAPAGLTCKLESLCFYLSSVLVDSSVPRNPPNAKPENVGGNAKNAELH